MPYEKAPSSGAFLPLSLMHILSGAPMHDLSGVDIKRWRDTRMALRWTGAAMQEAAKGFRRLRRLKAHKQLPTLRAALLAHQVKHSINPDIEKQAKAA